MPHMVRHPFLFCGVPRFVAAAKISFHVTPDLIRGPSQQYGSRLFAIASAGMTSRQYFAWHRIFLFLIPPLAKGVGGICHNTITLYPRLYRPSSRNQEAVFVPVLCRPKNGYPQERAPSNSARLKSGFPHKRHVHGGGKNSHILALRQLADRNPGAHVWLGIAANGFLKPETKKIHLSSRT